MLRLIVFIFIFHLATGCQDEIQEFERINAELAELDSKEKLGKVATVCDLENGPCGFYAKAGIFISPWTDWGLGGPFAGVRINASGSYFPDGVRIRIEGSNGQGGISGIYSLDNGEVIYLSLRNRYESLCRNSDDANTVYSNTYRISEVFIDGVWQDVNINSFQFGERVDCIESSVVCVGVVVDLQEIPLSVRRDCSQPDGGGGPGVPSFE